MPRGDRTGPAGMGPMTGRGAGFCAGYNVPGFMNSGGGCGYWGRGRGMGRGRGFGWARAGFGGPAWGGAVNPYAYDGVPSASNISAQQELEYLKEQAEYLKASLDEINKRVEQLKTESEK